MNVASTSSESPCDQTEEDADVQSVDGRIRREAEQGAARALDYRVLAIQRDGMSGGTLDTVPVGLLHLYGLGANETDPAEAILKELAVRCRTLRLAVGHNDAGVMLDLCDELDMLERRADVARALVRHRGLAVRPLEASDDADAAE